MRIYIASFALLIALFAVNGFEFFHHHGNDEAHSTDKCEACFFNKLLDSTESAVTESGINVLSSYQIHPLDDTDIPRKNLSDSSNDRAPPSL